MENHFSKNKLHQTKLLFGLLIISLTISACMSYTDYSLRNINVLNLLMPYSDEITMKYIIQAFNGCYKWNSNYPDTLQIDPLPDSLKSQYLLSGDNQSEEKCENTVMVSVGKKNNYDGIVWLKANDVETGEFLKCEAKVKPIKRLEILTKFRTLDVGDHEQIELIGYDEENNSFTTLEGLKFVWSVQGVGQADFVSFKNSKFKSSAERHKLENMGYQSDIVILKGIRTGKVTLTVRLLDSSYDEEISTEVDIFVIEHFEIEPQSDLFMLPCSFKQLSLYKVKTENYKLLRTLVDLPSNDFFWETSDASLLELNNDGILKTFKDIGVGKYKVVDKSKEDNRIERNVSVTIPFTINMYVKEIQEEDLHKKNSDDETISSYENNWNLLRGKYYRIMVGLFDKNDYKISLGDNDSFEFSYDPSKFEIIDKQKDFIVVKPIKKSKNSKLISAELNLHNNSCMDEMFKVSKEYSILSGIKILEISDGIAMLPTNGQKMKLFAIGGSGNYEWTSSNTQVLRTEQNGTVISGESGNAMVTVKDRNNLKNEASMRIQVSEAMNLELVEWKIELLTGGEREVMFSATDNQRSKFTYCSNLTFNFDSQDKTGLDIDPISYSTDNFQQALLNNQNIRNYVESSKPQLTEEMDLIYSKIFSLEKYSQYIKEKEITKENLSKAFNYYKVYGICSGFKFRSERVGEYQLKHALMKKTGYLRVYNNYKFQYPDNYDIKIFGERPVVLYNSSMKIFLKDGPWVWKDSKASDANLHHKLLISNKSQKNMIKVLNVQITDEGTILEIKCNSDGSFDNEDIDFYLKGSNKPDEDLLNPVEAKGLIQISCKSPSGLKMFNVKDGENMMTYLSREKRKLGLNLGGKYGFVAELVDNFDHLFWAKNSGLFEWNVNPAMLGRFSDDGLNNFKNTLQLSDTQKGSGKIEVVMNKIKDNYDVSGKYSSFSELNSRVKDQFMIESLDQLTLSPDNLLLFLHPDNSAKVKIGNGSGKFNIKYDKDYITAKYNSKTQEILIIPKRLGQTILTVEDMTAEAKMNAEVIIDIVEIRRLKAELQHKIMEENQNTKINLEVFDEQNRKIPYDQYKYMDLKVGVSDRKGGNIETNRIESPKDDGLFIATPLKADLYNLEIVGVDSTGTLKRSNKMNVSVFEKMRAHPEKLHLMKGSISGFEIIGGPDQELRKKYDFGLKFDQSQNIGKVIERDDGVFEYRALKNGEETIRVSLINKRNKKKVGEVLVNVLVDTPTGFDLVGFEGGKMLTSSLTRVIAIPTNSNGAFSPGMYPIEYQWNNVNKDIVNIEQTAAEEACGQIPTGDSESSSISKEDLDKVIIKGWQAMGKNIRGLSSGFAEVEVVGKLNNSTLSRKSINIEVIDGLKAKRDKYIKVKGCEEGILLLPPNSLFQIELEGIPQSLNINYHFAILHKESENLVLTNSIGKLKTSNEEGYSLLKVSEKKNPANELLLPVLVKTPSQLIIEDSSKVALVPVKSSMTLKARMIDSLGRVFAHPILNQKLSVISSDSKIIDAHYNINKGEVKVYAKRDGETTLMVSDPNNPKLFDILAVKIGALITPASPIQVHSGGNIKFKINNRILLDKSKWKSSNNDVIRIEDGKVKALASGKSILRFDESVNLSSVINVFQIDKIEEVKFAKVLTNIPTHKDFNLKYNFTFRMFADNKEIDLIDMEMNNPEIDHGLEWDCLVDSSSLKASKIKFKRLDNQNYFGCVVEFAKWTTNDAWDFNKRANLTMQIQNPLSGFKISRKLSLELVHGFFVEEESSQSNLTLDNDNRKKEIKIKSKEKLSLNFSHSIFKKYTKIRYIPEESIMHLMIDLPEDLSETLIKGYIHLNSQSTGQKTKLEIIYDPSSTILKRLKNWSFSFPFSKMNISWSDLFILIALLSVIVFVYKVISTKKPEHNFYNQPPPFMEESRFR